MRMAARCSRIAERLSGHRYELPRVGRRVERKLQDTVGRTVAHLTVGPRSSRFLQVLATRAHDKLAHALGRVRCPRRCLRCEPLVVVVVRVQHDVRAPVVQRVPQRLHGGEEVCPGGAEPRMMPIRECALLGVSGELGAQPLFLGRSGGHRDVVVQHHDMPRTQVVAVVVLRRVPRGRAEVLVVSRGARGLVILIAYARPRPRFIATP